MKLGERLTDPPLAGGERLACRGGRAAGARVRAEGNGLKARKLSFGLRKPVLRGMVGGRTLLKENDASDCSQGQHERQDRHERDAMQRSLSGVLRELL